LALLLGDPAFKNQKQVLLGPAKLQATTIWATPLDSSLLDTICQQLPSDDFAKDVFAHIDPNHASCSTFPRSSQRYKEFKQQDNLLFYKNLPYFPDKSLRLRVLEHCHDACLAGHFGMAKTMELIKR
jgi:hypothetical protein